MLSSGETHFSKLTVEFNENPFGILKCFTHAGRLIKRFEQAFCRYVNAPTKRESLIVLS
jgi:hypothetical protein